MKPARILHIIGGMDRAGAETMLMNLYRALNKEEFQFDFLYFTDKECAYDKEIFSLGGEIFRITEKNFVKRTKLVYDFLKNHSYKTVHSHMLLYNGFLHFAAKRAGVNNRISHIHSTADRNNIAGKIYYVISKFLNEKLSTNYIACGEAAKQYMYGDRIDVLNLPNAVDVEYFSSKKKEARSQLRDEFRISDDTLVLVHIARFSEVKNHLFSIELAKKLEKNNLNFIMVFAGDGPLISEIETYIQANGLEKRVALLGRRSDIAEILAAADIMILPSLYEGFPVVLVESQSAGTPAIISNKVSPEVDLGVGMVFPVELDVDIWYKKVKQISEMPSKMTTEQRKNILKEKKFDMYSSVRILEEFYSNL